MPRIPCSVPILTRNAHPHLVRLLPVLVELFDDVFLVDGNSTDGTRELAQRLGMRVEPQAPGNAAPNIRITDFTEARLRSWNLARHDWIFIVDADEEPTRALLEVVRETVEKNDPSIACRFRRLIRLPDQRIVTHALVYPEETMVRLFHRASGVSLAPGRKVHERFTIPPTVHVERRTEAFIHAWPEPTVFRQKLAHYASMEYDGWERKGFGDTWRWVVWYNLKSAIGQSCRAVWSWSVGRGRGRVALPWAYARPFIAYRFRAMAQGLRRIS